MSIGIGWKPAKNDLNHFASSNALHSILDEEFGIPCTLGQSDVGFLRGLVAAGYKDCEDLIVALTHHDLIKIEAMY